MKSGRPERVERRLAAILAADVTGYSRLIEVDEEGTLSRLKALRAGVIDPRIAAHRGRIVKTTGDGLLVEFASVVDALRCAAEMQAGLAEDNTAMLSDRRIALRIGIHQGDIVVDAGELDEQAVAGGLDDAAAMGGDPWIDHSGAKHLQPAEGAFLVGFDQARVAGDIGREDRREPTFDAFGPCRLHGASSLADNTTSRNLRRVLGFVR